MPSTRVSDLESEAIAIYEKRQKQGVLERLLWMMLVLALAIGFVNLRLGGRSGEHRTLHRRQGYDPGNLPEPAWPF